MEAIERIAKHLAVLNDEVGIIEVDVAIVKTDVRWLTKATWFQLGLLGSLLLAALGYILFA